MKIKEETKVKKLTFRPWQEDLTVFHSLWLLDFMFLTKGTQTLGTPDGLFSDWIKHIPVLHQQNHLQPPNTHTHKTQTAAKKNNKISHTFSCLSRPVASDVCETMCSLCCDSGVEMWGCSCCWTEVGALGGRGAAVKMQTLTVALNLNPLRSPWPSLLSRAPLCPRRRRRPLLSCRH